MKTEKGQRSQSMMCIFIAAVIWGTIGIFVDRLSDFGLSSMEIVFLRTLTAAIALVLYVVFADRKSLRRVSERLRGSPCRNRLSARLRSKKSISCYFSFGK